jgi:AraC-like DNA-binding protein
VSVATGFADQSHFTRSFRRITGMTPALFRSVVLRAT